MLMAEKGYTPCGFAKAANMSNATLRMIVRGKGVSPQTAKKICDFLGVRIRDYFVLEGLGRDLK